MWRGRNRQIACYVTLAAFRIYRLLKTAILTLNIEGIVRVIGEKRTQQKVVLGLGHKPMCLEKAVTGNEFSCGC